MLLHRIRIAFDSPEPVSPQVRLNNNINHDGRPPHLCGDRFFNDNAFFMRWTTIRTKKCHLKKHRRLEVETNNQVVLSVYSIYSPNSNQCWITISAMRIRLDMGSQSQRNKSLHRLHYTTTFLFRYNFIKKSSDKYRNFFYAFVIFILQRMGLT